MNSKNTKRALLTSLLALVLCFSMLVGTTYAWFTDSVTSGNNRILAGNLDIELYNGLDSEAPKVDTTTKLFDGINLWEPGVVAYENLTVANVGTLALKYQLAVNFLNENATTDGHKLSDILKVAVVKGGVKDVSDDAAGRSKLIESIAAADWKTMGSFVETGSLYSVETAAADATKASSVTYGIVIYWQPSATDNNYNVNNGKTTTDGQPLHIDFGVTLFATQEEYESDSFDEHYDADAPSLFTVNGTAYDTAEAALAAAVDGDTVVLSNVTEPIVIDKAINLELANANIVAASGNAVTVTANATIEIAGYVNVVGASGAHGISVENGAALTLTGTGSLIASGNNGTENTEVKAGGSGIYGADGSSITIDSLSSLSAYGYGQAGFGIGGATKSVTIKDTNVNYAKGGYVASTLAADDLWGKKASEGGAAIGSWTDGAVITITDSTIASAIGGSKAAGIGARYHTGVTVNITNSTVNAIGGNASAGIGGSRVVKAATQDDAITVTITNSTVNATGGQYGAGIGSGYDTYCHSADTAPATTVTIDAASEIIAQGGKLAAGIGTGHNAVNFVGNIACDKDNVKAGDSNDVCCLGAECTVAENVGLGSLKKSAFLSTVSIGGHEYFISKEMADSITYNTNNIETVNSVAVYSASDLAAARQMIADGLLIANGTNDIDAKIIFKADINYGGAEWAAIGMDIDIVGNGYTFSNVVFTPNANGQAGLYSYSGNCDVSGLTLKDITVSGSQAGAFAGNATNTHLTDCALAGTITVNWAANEKESYNGVGSVFGVTSGGSNTIDVDTADATIVINQTGITYPAGYSEYANDMIGVDYGATSIVIVK